MGRIVEHDPTETAGQMYRRIRNEHKQRGGPFSRMLKGVARGAMTSMAYATVMKSYADERKATMDDIAAKNGGLSEEELGQRADSRMGVNRMIMMQTMRGMGPMGPMGRRLPDTSHIKADPGPSGPQMGR